MRVLILVVACLIAGPVCAAEFVAVGHVTQQTLEHFGAPHCPPICPANADKRMVCITNACGCGKAKIAIDHVLIGKPVPEVSVSYTLGEWCQPEFPISNPKVLIRLTGNGQPQWGQVRPLQSGGFVFDVSHFERIGSVNVSNLKQSHGWASLHELEVALGL